MLPPQIPRGLSGIIGLRGRISVPFFGVDRSLLIVTVVVLIELRLSLLSLSGNFLFAGTIWPLLTLLCSLALAMDGLLLSELLTFRSSWLSIAVLLCPPALLGGGSKSLKNLYSASEYSASVLQPFQQSLQSHTRNLKQYESIFIHGWKQMQRFLKSILFLSAWASRRERWQVIAKRR